MPNTPAAAPAFELLRPRAVSRVLLVCDHASPAIPREFGGLGLARAEIERHIGWDIGAAAVTRELSRLLDSPAVLSAVSRLVIDCNRSLDHATSIPATSDGVTIPGNLGLDARERERRAALWFHPYHRTIAHELARIERRRRAAVLVSIHSFTPAMRDGRARPWKVGVLWNRDPRLAPAAIALLRAMGHRVGDNLPYSGRRGAYTVDRHAARHGRPHIAFEIRQDLIADAKGVRLWARRLHRALDSLLDRPSIGARIRY